MNSGLVAPAHANASRGGHGVEGCLAVRDSEFSGAGSGLFSECDLPAGTLLGEYIGKVYSTAWKVPNDGAYTWKVPACDDDRVLTRADQVAWDTCGNRNGFVYIDAQDIDRVRGSHANPLRFVNGAAKLEQRHLVNVDALLRSRRVFYFASRPLNRGDELVIDYGPQYWLHLNAQGPDDDAPARTDRLEPSSEIARGKPVHSQGMSKAESTAQQVAQEKARLHESVQEATAALNLVRPSPLAPREEAARPALRAPPVPSRGPAPASTGEAGGAAVGLPDEGDADLSWDDEQ